MSKTRAQKIQEVEALSQAFQSGTSAMFADYRGMTVPAITILRKKFHAAGVQYVVAKKSLLTHAAKRAGYEINFSAIPGMIAVAFAKDDEIAPAKLIGDAGKELPIKLLGGIFEGKFVDAAYAQVLSKLPNKIELLGKLLYALQRPIVDFVLVLDARREKQAT